MDCRPSLEVDADNSKLEKICRIIVQRRLFRKISTAPKVTNPESAENIHQIKRISRRRADAVIRDIRYYSTNTEYDPDKYHRHLLTHRIEAELLRQYTRGIVCFAERDDCPLMWSHYGDHHRGMCIGYSIPSRATGDVHKVEYGGNRLVLASKVAAMLNGNENARREVERAVLLRKAPNWKYEKEWRLIGNSGSQRSPLELEEIIFGLKCNSANKYITMKILRNRDRSVKFYEMREELGTFNLRKCALSYDEELFVHYPRRNLSIDELFENVSDAE